MDSNWVVVFIVFQAVEPFSCIWCFCACKGARIEQHNWAAGAEVAKPFPCHLNGWTSANAWDAFNLCWLFLRARKSHATANIRGGAKQKILILTSKQWWYEAGFERNVCELIIWLWLLEIWVSSDSWLYLLCCLLTSWSDFWFRRSATSGESDVAIQGGFILVLLLSLALKVAKCSADVPFSSVLWLPGREWPWHDCLPGSCERNAIPGVCTACQLIPEMLGNGNRHCLLTTRGAAAFLSTLGSLDGTARCFWGSGHSLSG